MPHQKMGLFVQLSAFDIVKILFEIIRQIKLQE